MKQDYPVLKRDYPLNKSSFGMWANEKDSLYVEKKALTGILGNRDGVELFLLFPYEVGYSRVLSLL